MKRVGENILKYRKLRGITQAALAYTLNVTPQAVSKWENSISDPDINLLMPLSKVLGVPVERLLSSNDLEEDISKVSLHVSKNDILQMVQNVSLASDSYDDTPFMTLKGTREGKVVDVLLIKDEIKT